MANLYANRIHNISRQTLLGILNEIQTADHLGGCYLVEHPDIWTGFHLAAQRVGQQYQRFTSY